ncbi:DNA-directed RNA polymerase I subunit RPA12 [Callorhinchus milii]|uniref:DNA-directed RNA polymerase subunit n=2 Tax=Callorhinchus milii TaxID=7868 RepID=V9LFP4_CALMI|nr:DNA-directed RNA polymerase I subunit RPA12 [Callorhinchus milii]
MAGLSGYCSDCGAVLPPPGAAPRIICGRCGHSTDIREYEGKIIRSTLNFNNPEVLAAALNMNLGSGELGGPVVDRKCQRCGHEGMEYHTRQTRSADEGQTVFYTCTNCRYQEKEDS